MADKAKAPLLVICGPTATGKTALSIRLCEQLSGEVISADSMQIYDSLDIGTAKPTARELAAAKHHLIGFLQPEQQFSAADYAALASEKIADITARGKLPLMVGGTGLYIETCIKGIRFTGEKPQSATRADLNARAEAEGMDVLYHELSMIDPPYAAKLHPNNKLRVLRALELYTDTGVTMSQQLADSRPSEPPYKSLVVALQYSNRALLYERINARVDEMLQNHLLEEAQRVFENRLRYRTAAQAIGYKEFFPYFEGTATLADCTEKLKQASRNYAKRQLTWFRRMQDVHWIQVDEGDALPQVLALWERMCEP